MKRICGCECRVDMLLITESVFPKFSHQLLPIVSHSLHKQREREWEGGGVPRYSNSQWTQLKPALGMSELNLSYSCVLYNTLPVVLTPVMNMTWHLLPSQCHVLKGIPWTFLTSPLCKSLGVGRGDFVHWVSVQVSGVISSRLTPVEALWKV